MSSIHNFPFNTMFFTIIICIIFLIGYSYIITYKVKDTEISEIDILSEYNLSKNKIKSKGKKVDKLCDKFNIKEFDFINDNIIIHNKFKTELLDYQTDKNLVQSKIEELKKQKQLELNKSFHKNIELETQQHLNKDIILIKEDIKSLKLLFKEDINNIINDIKDQKLTFNDKNQIINIISSEINKTNKQLQLTLHNQQNSKLAEYEYKIKLLQQKINILEKKLKIYNELFNK